MKAIVLSGGGAKGAYEVGVWKALRKLNIKYDIVTGTSIGAVNGMFMAQNHFYRCLNLWKTIDYNTMFDNFTESEESIDIYMSYLNHTIKGGLKLDKMEKIMDKYYRPKDLYNNVKFGVPVFNLSTRKFKYATTLNTNPKKLRDYIVASGSCFPVFKPKKIRDDFYIDGAYYDNIPINLAVELGATEIIAIDLETFALVKSPNIDMSKITYIRPSVKLESFLMFENKRINRMIKIGYNDAMKVFKKLDGVKYTFKKGVLKYFLNTYYDEFNVLCKKLKVEVNEDKFLKTFDNLGEMFDIDVTKVYNKREFLKNVNDEFLKTEDIEINNFSIEKIKKIFKSRYIIKEIYNKLENNKKLSARYFVFFQDELLCALLLKCLRR